jgi:hypothetical protein
VVQAVMAPDRAKRPAARAIVGVDEVVRPLVDHAQRADGHQKRQSGGDPGKGEHRDGDVDRHNRREHLPRDEHQRDVAGIGMVQAMLARDERVEGEPPDAARPPVQDAHVHQPLVEGKRRDRDRGHQDV